MAANAKQGLLLEAAIEEWTKAVYRRNDYSERRRLGIKSKTTPYVIPDDVAILNRIRKDEDRSVGRGGQRGPLKGGDRRSDVYEHESSPSTSLCRRATAEDKHSKKEKGAIEWTG